MAEETKNTLADETVEKAVGTASEEVVEEKTDDKENPASEEEMQEAVEDASCKEATEENQSGATEEKKNIFKKKKDKKDEQIEELTDRVKRQMAEFENFRKRTEKEKTQMFDMGAKTIIEKILPVVDNLERGFDGLSEEEKEAPFVKGIEQVYKQFVSCLDEIGVKPIEAVGQEFNPELHNAVMHDEDENFGENTVSQEFQKGYMYKESVVRHSMVKVSN